MLLAIALFPMNLSVREDLRNIADIRVCYFHPDY